MHRAWSLGILFTMAAMVGLGDVPGDLEKWIETDPPEPGTRRWGVANYDTKHEWFVSLLDERPQARLRNAKDEAPSPLPFILAAGKAKEGLAGRRLSVEVSDGWLVGYNAGEFGGGLWWYSPDGKKRYKVADVTRIRGFIPTDAGLLALEGLAHMSSSKGRILRLTQAPGGRWRSEEFLDLGHAPEASAKAADGSLIVATTDRLLKVDPATKGVEVLVDGVFWGGLYPNSMTLAPSGAVYLGMRHGVAKVEKQGEAWRVRWLVPDEESK